MNCPNCQTLNPDGARFCFNCGNALAITCRNCGTSLAVGAKFCYSCGYPVAAEQSAPVQPATPSQPETESDLLQRFIPKELLAKLAVLEAAGQEEPAMEKRIAAQSLVIEIADQICDPDLRLIYWRSALAKVWGETSSL